MVKGKWGSVECFSGRVWVLDSFEFEEKFFFCLCDFGKLVIFLGFSCLVFLFERGNNKIYLVGFGYIKMIDIKSLVNVWNMEDV